MSSSCRQRPCSAGRDHLRRGEPRPEDLACHGLAIDLPPGRAVPQVLKMVSIPKPMEPGDTFQARSQAVAWTFTAVPYRCEIEFGGSLCLRRCGSVERLCHVHIPEIVRRRYDHGIDMPIIKTSK